MPKLQDFHTYWLLLSLSPFFFRTERQGKCELTHLRREVAEEDVYKYVRVCKRAREGMCVCAAFLTSCSGVFRRLKMSNKEIPVPPFD